MAMFLIFIAKNNGNKKMSAREHLWSLYFFWEE